jgi:hypothetical protein
MWVPRNFTNGGCSSRGLNLKIFPAVLSVLSLTHWRPLLSYGTST